MPDASSPAAGPRPEPFVTQTAPAVLDDLRARLRATRWPDAPEDAGWSLGTDLAYLRELVAYWVDGFDWPAQEAALRRKVAPAYASLERDAVARSEIAEIERLKQDARPDPLPRCGPAGWRHL